jgi:hypothetical protein
MCDHCGQPFWDDERFTILIHTGAGIRHETVCELCYESFDDGEEDDLDPAYDFSD